MRAEIIWRYECLKMFARLIRIEARKKVFIIQNRNNNEMYAMKYILNCKINEYREIEILNNLHHPFIPVLYYTLENNNNLFIVLDLLMGGDLRYHLKNKNRFTQDEVFFYFCEISLALDYLQSKKIIHRDIKLDNLVLDESGHVHITDFNVAIKLTGMKANSLSGTKPYMAPEIFECALDLCDNYGYEVDWWSLGICLYEMITGSLPYDIHSDTAYNHILSLQSKPLNVVDITWLPLASFIWKIDDELILNNIKCEESDEEFKNDFNTKKFLASPTHFILSPFKLLNENNKKKSSLLETKDDIITIQNTNIFNIKMEEFNSDSPTIWTLISNLLEYNYFDRLSCFDDVNDFININTKYLYNKQYRPPFIPDKL